MSLSTSVPRYIVYFGAVSILNITILNSNVRIFGSFDVSGLYLLTFLTYRSFAYFLWCQFVVGWRKMIYLLTFYFVNLLLIMYFVIFVFRGALNVVVWRYQWKPRKLVFNEWKWIHSLWTERKLENLPFSLKYSSWAYTTYELSIYA
jgi:hypothetical protein